MENNIEPEVIHFLDKYYNNPQIERNDFLQAIREKISQFSDPEQQKQFIFAIIKEGKLIRDKIELHLREDEIYKLTGKEF